MRQATEKEIKDFCTYRANHVALVQRIGQVVFGKNFSDHDYDKITADGDRLNLYALRNAMINGTYHPHKEDKVLLNRLVGEHVKSQKHHPEYWDPSISAEDFDADNPPQVMATRMPDSALLEMCCDWAAVSLKRNQPLFKWINANALSDTRFVFSDRQKRLIVEATRKIIDAIRPEHLSYPGISYSAKQVDPIFDPEKDMEHQREKRDSRPTLQDLMLISKRYHLDPEQEEDRLRALKLWASLTEKKRRSEALIENLMAKITLSKNGSRLESLDEARTKTDLISDLKDLQQDAVNFSKRAMDSGYTAQAIAAEGKAVAYNDAINLARDLTDGVVVRSLTENRESACAFTFARMNPITKGHLETVIKALSEQPGEKRVYLSHTQDKKNAKDPLKNKNPLSYDDKVRFAELAVKDFYPEVKIQRSEAKTVLAVLAELYQEGFRSIVFIVGSDRIEDFKNLISKYNGEFSEDGKGYDFPDIRYICAGERIDTGDDIQSMSASKLRKLAVENNLPAFIEGSPFRNPWIAEEEFMLIQDMML